MAETADSRGPVPASNGRPRRGFWARLFGSRAKDEAGLEAWRRLALNLQFHLGDAPGNCTLLLTSPTTNRTLAQASLKLAHFLADERGHRVLVIDGSCGGKGLSHLLGAEERSGLLNLLDGTVTALADVVVPSGHPGVTFLPVGRTSTGVTGLLAGAALAALLEHARQDYDDVLIHTGAVLEDPSTLAFPPIVDGVLLFVVEGQTRVQDVDESQRILSACRARKVGLVLATSGR